VRLEMDLLRIPPPLGPPLAVACYHNRVDEVKRLLASGADPLEESKNSVTAAQYRPLFLCIHYGYAACVKVLLTVRPELVDSGATLAMEANKIPPLLYLLQQMGNERDYIRHPLEWPGSDPLGCVRLLLDAGASLQPVVQGGWGCTYTHLIGQYALWSREKWRKALVRMIGGAARLRYSTKTHRDFPRPARYAAAELLRLGYQIESGVLTPVWAEHVLPFLVTRTSRGAVPSPPPALLFIDALSESELKKMVACGDAAKLELRRRGIGKYPPLV